LALRSEEQAEAADNKGCPFKGRCHRKLGVICDTEFPPLRTAGSGHVVLCHITVEELPTATTRTAGLAQPVEA
jgi:peptide/nickel transport system ATP-binding protein